MHPPPLSSPTSPSALPAPEGASQPARWRRPVLAATLAYVGLAGATLAAWLWWTQRAAPPASAWPCVLPLLLTAWLGWQREPDDRQFVVKQMAALGFGPLLLGFWAGGSPAPDGAAAWPWMLPAALAHGAAFVGAVLWLGRYVTRVGPAPGAHAVDTATLRRRLAALPAAGVPCVLEAGEAGGHLVFAVPAAGPGRRHQVTLHLDAARREVHVGERLSAAGARPLDAAEASLRRVGEPLADAARPQAQSVSGAVWQTTLIVPQRLAAQRLRMTDDRVELPAGPAGLRDGEAVVTLLCAVVTRSGWAWQPGWKV